MDNCDFYIINNIDWENTLWLIVYIIGYLITWRLMLSPMYIFTKTEFSSKTSQIVLCCWFTSLVCSLWFIILPGYLLSYGILHHTNSIDKH